LVNNITDLLNITKKVVAIVEESEKFVFVALRTDSGMKTLFSRLIALYDGLIPSNAISINELTQNNYEFLDTLKAIIIRVLQNTQINNRRERAELESFNVRIDLLIAELNLPPFLQHLKPSDEILHDNRSDADLTEPRKDRFIRKRAT
jgi:hypothetical protein